MAVALALVLRGRLVKLGGDIVKNERVQDWLGVLHALVPMPHVNAWWVVLHRGKECLWQKCV